MVLIAASLSITCSGNVFVFLGPKLVFVSIDIELMNNRGCCLVRKNFKAEQEDYVAALERCSE